MEIEGEADLQMLRDVQQGIAEERVSVWQPRLVAHAFAEKRRGLTMQGWINLDAIRSPLLSREALTGPQDVLNAAVAMTWVVDLDADEDELIEIGAEMRRAVDEAFSTAITVRHPDAKGDAPTCPFGTWLPILTALLADLHFTLNDALNLRAKKAYALVACERSNRGWSVEGLLYWDREGAAE